MTNGFSSGDVPVTVYLGLGSNLGNRETNLMEAIGRISKLVSAVTRESSIYETEPVGYRDQPRFLNKVVETKVNAGTNSVSGPSNPTTRVKQRATAFLAELLKIERVMGRTRSIVQGPRLIDIDLLLFGDAIITPSITDEAPIIEGSDICVPHPRMHQRRFVLEPLCEIAPAGEHPLLRKTFRELLASLQDESDVRLYRSGRVSR